MGQAGLRPVASTAYLHAARNTGPGCCGTLAVALRLQLRFEATLAGVAARIVIS